MSYQLAVDIGGTFTDLYVQKSDGETDSFKVPTTSGNLIDGLFSAFEKAGTEYGVSVEDLLSDSERFVHGTTIATNAILENETAKTALICTEGFRETLFLREGGKEDPYDWSVNYPDPYIPRSLTFGVKERVNAEGEVVKLLDEDDVIEAIAEFEERNVGSVAVALLWSHVNPEHERRIAELFDEHAPEIHYSLSHEINPIIREYRRTSTTAINASIHDLLADYISDLGRRLTESGFNEEPLLITANGGTIQLDEASRRPVWLVDAGPTMLPIATTNLVDAEVDKSNVISLDMGGTSLDINVATEGEIPRTREAKVADDILGIEKIDVRSIGSGGGSIAWVDEGGLLRVGPESAGAYPGPVCYQRGGEKPTVTDAALLLGYLNEDYFLGGDMMLDKTAARRAIEEKVGDKLGIGTVEAAYSIYATIVQDMANGIKGVTIEQGIDPRNYVLSGGGGALGLFAIPIARELQIDRLILPRDAGVVSSIGGLMSDVRRDFSMSEFTTHSKFDFNAVNDVLASLESQANEFFNRIGAERSNRSLDFYTEARYPQQVWELQVELPNARVGEDSLEVLVEKFHDKHEDVYGFSTTEDIEFLYWRVEATNYANVDRDRILGGDSGQTQEGTDKHREREAFFGDESRQTPTYRADGLSTNDTVTGPSFVEAENTTIVLPPNSELTVTDLGNYLLSS